MVFVRDQQAYFPEGGTMVGIDNQIPNPHENTGCPGEAQPFPAWFTASKYTHRIAVEILQHGPISRVSLARRFNLTQGAVSRITNDLAHRGVIREAGTLPQADKDPGSENGGNHSSNSVGRPQQALVVRRETKTFIGINLHGGTAMATATDLACRPVGRSHSHHIRQRSPGQVVRMLSNLTQDCTREISQAGLPSPSGLAISLGGRAERDRIVTYAPFLHWSEPVDLATEMENTCDLPCLVFNDLDALALYEGWFGDGIGLDRVALITMGSGIGYALSEHSMPVSSPDEGFGLIGHQLVDPDGPVCYLGHRGCAQCLTTGSLTEQYSHAIGQAANLDKLVKDLEEDMPQAETLLNLTGYRLGVLIALVANAALPDKVLVSGETSYLMKRCIESVRKGIASFRHSQMVEVPVRIIGGDWLRWAQAPAARAIARYLQGPEEADKPI